MSGDSRTPEALRGRVGKWIVTKYVDESAGIYVYENQHNGIHHLFLLIDDRWIWVMKAQLPAELRGLAAILLRMGHDINDVGVS